MGFLVGVILGTDPDFRCYGEFGVPNDNYRRHTGTNDGRGLGTYMFFYL